MKPRRKALAKRTKKAANSSDEAGYSSDSEEEEVPKENLPKENTEEIQYDQQAILDNPNKSALPSKALLSLRRSPRHAVEWSNDIPSVSAKPKMLSKTSAKRKKASAEEVDVPTKKAKKNVPKTVDEPQEYDHMLFMDILDSVAYEAKPEAIESLELPFDVKKLAIKFFVELKEISDELTVAQNDKKLLEKEKRDAKTEFETKGLDKQFVDVTMPSMLSGRRNWHGTHV